MKKLTIYKYIINTILTVSVMCVVCIADIDKIMSLIMACGCIMINAIDVYLTEIFDDRRK